MIAGYGIHMLIPSIPLPAAFALADSKVQPNQSTAAS